MKKRLLLGLIGLLQCCATGVYGYTMINSCTMKLLHTSDGDSVVDTRRYGDSEAVIRVSTEWDEKEGGTLRINGVERHVLTASGEKDFVLALLPF